MWRFLWMMCVGNMLEWYDFGIFMTTIPRIMPQFFADNTPYFTTLFLGYGILAAGYLARPLGGLLLGHQGDREGKFPVFVLTLLLMSIPSLCIAVLPLYATMGILAPIILLLLRLLQGFSAGGECMSVLILSYELAPLKWRNLTTIATWISSGFGLLLGSGFIALLQGLFGQAQFTAGYWRISFLMGGILGIGAFFIRRSAKQLWNSPAVGRVHQPLMQTLKEQADYLFYFSILFMPVSSMFYLIFFYMPTYVHVFTRHQASPNSLDQLCILLGIQIMPLIIAYILPSPDWKRVLKISLILFMVLLLPVYAFILQGKWFWIGQGILMLPVSLYAVGALFHALEIAPIPVRFTLLASSYNFSYALFGNIAPLILIYGMLTWHSPLLIAIYLFSLALITWTILCFFSPGKMPRDPVYFFKTSG
jgi:MHS family proline/betaine transporter-like MFS transporter